MSKVMVIGAGVAGCVAARELAEKGYSVYLVEKRNHIGGNAFDFVSANGILNQRYGAHLFHTNEKKVMDYLKGFSDFFEYRHRVVGDIDGKLVPIPFNLKSLELSFEQSKAIKLENYLLQTYGYGETVPIIEMRKSDDPRGREIAEFIYEKVFLHYTEKQWSMQLEDLDPSVGNRVPVTISYECGYFGDTYQCMPTGGFTKMFEKMLNHENINLELDCDALNGLILKNGTIFYRKTEIPYPVIYTGCLDKLFSSDIGTLPYRSLKFVEKSKSCKNFQEYGVINYPNEHQYTRIIEFKHFTGKYDNNATDIVYEYPCDYTGDNTPYYPVPQQKNRELYDRYAARLKEYPNIYALGRLAEYKYYNMDQAVMAALELVERF